MRAVFDIRRHSPQHPEITLRYTLPNRRIDLDIARACINGWIIFRETGRSGGLGYVSLARVEDVKRVAEGVPVLEVVLADYLAFPEPVPFKSGEYYFGREAREPLRSSQVGRLFQGRAIRELSDQEFGMIVAAGLGVNLALARILAQGWTDT